ncbi:hypothetical protein HT136_13170 [Novosphingobium profundi]|uniref:lysozyme inhibitor LprI family protein n=1 Tax=Novosphingobium profundi TaxID=1774954 RepID=UPI001BD96844|nr:lysozyme inhibitor LprI family protein [Novosphingobium profundi]MBT0669316.1 hypothetical protein [Novosphingobium profundi]
MSHLPLGALAILGAGLAAFSAPPASAADPERNGPSFDCTRAASEAERAICASKPLSSLDGQIGMRYAALRRGLDTSSAEKLKKDQQWFIARRDSAFGDAQARIPILKDRLTFLNAIDWSPPAGIEGVWSNLAGEIIVSRGPDGSLVFSANAVEPTNARWVCEESGKLATTSVSGWNTLGGDPEARLSFARSGATLEVSEPAGVPNPNCGLNGSLAGSYFHTAASAPVARTK